MKKLLEGAFQRSLSSIRRLTMSNRFLRNALMDFLNKREFTNLYEHERMLADRTRVETYRRAIEKQIQPGDTLMDLGTGSGILALFAAKTKPKKVYAIDHSDFIDVAKAIAAQRPDLNIQFQKVNSRHFNPQEKLDYILHEQIGDDLFEENMIENLLDLKSRVLKPGGKIFPGKFELYLEPFSLREQDRIPFLWEQTLCDIDFSFLRESPVMEPFKSVQRSPYLDLHTFSHFLCEAEPALTFDLNDESFSPEFSIPDQRRTVTSEGVMDGICLWFRVIFDEEIQFDTSPLNGWTSWGNRVFSCDNRHYYLRDQEIRYSVEMEELLLPQTWKFTFQVSEAERPTDRHVSPSTTPIQILKPEVDDT